MMPRSQFLVIVAAATLLVACGTPAPANREAELVATIAALEATITAGSPDAPREPREAATGDDKLPAATVLAEATAESPAELGVVTASMQELTLAGEPFAAEGDPNAPLTIIEFSDYG